MFVGPVSVLVADGPPVPVSEVEKTDTSWYVPVRLVALVDKDDQGKPVRFPSSLFSDSVMSEMYVVTGGQGRIIVYGCITIN